MHYHDCSILSVAARTSPLSRKQVEEVEQALRIFYPHCALVPQFLEARGDLDKTQSLRYLDKTDFFTRELDAQVLAGVCRMAVHSAKDLPDPLPEGLYLGALTQGIDPRDMLVLSEGYTLETLPPGARIGTSSLRREANILALRPDCVCVDIRGTIGERLQQLAEGALDAVVIAEAALLRLGWTHLHRVPLEGIVAPLQGRLAVVCRVADHSLRKLLKCIHDAAVFD